MKRIPGLCTTDEAMMDKFTPFRNWVRETWLENCEEHLTYSEDPYTIKQYWDKYKWWLKREFKYQKAKNDK
jgi:hypothetical protein